MDEKEPQVYFIVKNFLPIEQSRGGYHERVFGEITGFVDTYGGSIYSLDDSTLYSDHTPVNRIGSFALILGILLEFLKTGRKTTFCLVYPSVMRISYVLPLLFMGRFSKKIKIITIVHDLYKEQWEAFQGRPLYIVSLFVWILDTLFLKSISDKILVTSLTKKTYIEKKYGINPGKIAYSPNSSFPILIKTSKKPEVFTLLYSGSLMKEKGINELIKIVEELRAEDYRIELILLGIQLMDIHNLKKPWITSAYVTFPEIQAYYDKTSVCIISFKDNSYFNMVAPVKLFDYMAAGKPVISLKLTEISRILDKYSCGYTVNNFEDMKEKIKELYENSVDLETLGRNGRHAVETEFNWSKRVEQLRIIIENSFKE